MNHESLEQQTAPESTRGLFDDEGEQKPFSKRNSTLRSSIQLRPQTVTMNNNHQRNSKQRSRSAIFNTTPTPLRQSTGMDTLNEESNMTMDSLRDMIQTLKGLPPHISNKSKSPSAGLDGQNDQQAREAAFAEAEAKLMGTFSKKGLATAKKRASNSRYSFQHQLPVLSENQRHHYSMIETSNNNTSKINQKSLSLSFNNNNNNNRRSSRNSDDWRQSNRSSFHLVPFTPTRVSFSREDANPHQRRPLFIAHLPFSALTPLFRSRQLVRGYLRVNKRNRSDAYVTCDDLPHDIYICGSRNRNRALEGDVVAIRLVNVDTVLQEKQEKEDAKLAKTSHQQSRLPDEEDENEIMFGGDEETDIVRPKYAGIVVAILERAQNQVFSGILTLKRPSNNQQRRTEQSEENAPRIAWFKATDKRVPLIAIPIEQVPADFINNTEAYGHRLFVASIKRWPITSLHPFGMLERELGPIRDLSVQIQAILADNNITNIDFTDAVMQCFPPAPFRFTTCDDSRRDMSDTRLVTIDPNPQFPVYENGFTISQLNDDTFEIGVHVVDICYFIKPHSALDKEARSRSTAVAMDQKFIPMLPNELVEVAQFSVGDLKPATSIVWKMRADGSILDTWYGKTVVKAAAHYNYNQVQSIIGKGSTKEGTEKDLLMLYSLACHLHHKRYHKEAMSLQRQYMKFDSHHEPTFVSITSRPSIAKCIKEFLFLANACVAQKIASQYPDQAMLRNQAPPNEHKLNELKAYCLKYLGVQLETSNASSIQNSIEIMNDPALRQLVTVLVLKTIQPPKYFCSGVLDISKYMHFAAGAPLFTHFTSPLRRFTDIIVHRQLESALKGDKHFYLDCDTIQKLAQHSNVKKQAGLVAREQGKLLSLALYLANDRQKDHEATIIAVMSDAIDISMPEFGIERRIHLANLPIWRHSFDRQERALTIYWKEGVNPSFSGNMSDEGDLNHLDQSRASVTGLSTCDAFSHTVKALDKIRVIIHVQMVKTPPLIRILAANPFAQ
ncbi:RNB-domain-containing protein [Backusella circina FSU 941]|nr:RNB-domain-containing protein [Backusella circina FSU 941]